MAFGALVLVASYKAWPVLFPEVSVEAPLDPDCDLRAGSCTSKLPGGARISLAIKPESIPVIRPLRLDVKIEGIDADKVEVDLAGVDMNMGFNRVALEREGAGMFSGVGSLSVCVRDRMEWEARVLITTGKGVLAAPFRFITLRPGQEPPARSTLSQAKNQR